MKKPRERSNWEKSLPLVNSIRRLRGAEMISNELAQELYKKVQDKYPIDVVSSVLRSNSLTPTKNDDEKNTNR